MVRGRHRRHEAEKVRMPRPPTQAIGAAPWLSLEMFQYQRQIRNQIKSYCYYLMVLVSVCDCRLSEKLICMCDCLETIVQVDGYHLTQ